jgi:hypothetical protein
MTRIFKAALYIPAYHTEGKKIRVIRVIRV